MIDPAQTALFLVIVVLTVLLVVLGIQIFFILRELRKTIDKANKVLDDTGHITGTVSGPISALSSLASGIKTGASIIGLFKRGKKLLKIISEEGIGNLSDLLEQTERKYGDIEDSHEEKKKLNGELNKEVKEENNKSPIRRFFKRSR